MEENIEIQLDLFSDPHDDTVKLLSPTYNMDLESLCDLTTDTWAIVRDNYESKVVKKKRLKREASIRERE